MTTPKQADVVLLVKDPQWAFVSWELALPTLHRTRKEIAREGNGVHLCLRVHDVTDIIFDGQNSHSSYDVDVDGPTDHWYLQVPEAGRNYCVELGFKMGDRFVIAGRSNTAQHPKDGPTQAAWIP